MKRLSFGMMVLLICVGALQAGLVGQWDFEGNFDDVSGNSNNATAMGNTVLVNDAQRGLVAYFDGDATSYALVSNESNFDFADGVTITAWVKGAPQATDWVNIVTKFESYGLIKHWYTQALNGGITGLGDMVNWTTVFDDQWHFVAMTYDGAELAVYVDDLKGATALSGQITMNDSPVRIGGNSMSSIVGYVDDVRIYSEGLTEAQITDIRTIPEPATIAFLCAGAVAMFRRKRN